MGLDPLLGEVVMFAGNYAPVGWKICDGELMNINEFSSLYYLLGTTYGGDGVNTFALPDLRGRVPLHNGQGAGLNPIALGQTGGVESVTLNSRNIPPHSHSLDGITEEATTAMPSKTAFLATATQAAYVENKLQPIIPTPTTEPKEMLPTLAAMSSLSVAASVTGGQPVSILQPYLGINFIIAIEGALPSRD